MLIKAGGEVEAAGGFLKEKSVGAQGGGWMMDDGDLFTVIGRVIDVGKIMGGCYEGVAWDFKPNLLCP